MAKPIKICRNYSSVALKKVNESVESIANKKYVFQGVFTACSTPEKKIINRNGRIYSKTEVLKHLSYLRDAIKTQGCILGELDHPEGRFDIQLKEASHKIVDLWYDTKTDCVMGKIELLDTPNGNIAKELVDAGYPLFVSSRAAGDVDEDTHEVEIAQIFTYDIVCTPGFEEARLERINESMSVAALHYINESVGSKKKIKNSITVTESTEDFKLNERVIRALNTPVNMKSITTPLLEEDSEFKLPEPELNPNKADESEDTKSDDKEEKKDGDKVVKDESPEKKEKLDKKEDISEDDEEAKEEKRKAILGIKAEDADGNVINGDNETKSESEQEENRSKILKIYSEEHDGNDNEDKPAEESSDDGKEEVTDEDIQEANKIKNKVAKETDKTVDELESLLDSVIKTESVKESIIRRYPFSISLSEANFGKFAALRPNQKKKCAEFIEEHQIFDIAAINELWATPLRQEKRLQQNWLRLASQHDIDLYTMAPKEVQDSIEESAKYLVLETQEQVNEFWLRTGLRQAEARRLMNEQFVNNYKTASNSPYDTTMNQNNDNLGYSFDYIQMVEDMMKAGY